MNNKIILFPAVIKQSHSKTNKVPAEIRTLALALRACLNIATDDSLVFILGHGEAKTNQKAVENWLLDNYSLLNIKFMSSPLEEITNDLETYLNSRLMMEDGSC